MRDGYPDYEEIFPVGARVRCENEAWPGHWEYGTVECHKLNRYGSPQWISIRLHDDDLDVDYFSEYDYRYLDTDMRHSMVKLVKG